MTSPATLTKALLRASEQLGLSAALPAILQLSLAQMRELHAGERILDPQRQEWSGALKIVALFRTLVSMLGTAERARVWLNEPNQVLEARPVELLGTPDSDKVYRYLDAVSKHELRLPPSSGGVSS